MKQLLATFAMGLLLPMYTFAQPYHIGQKTIAFVDSSRNRPINVELWYPTYETDPQAERKTDLPFRLPPTIRNAPFIDQKLPLILLSHGSGGNRFSLAWLAIALANQGYIVAAPDHWGGTFGNMIPAYYIRYWERPLDLSFVLTKLLTDDAMTFVIDPEKIGAVGYSFGGYTALALAGADIDCGVLKRNAETKPGKKEFSIPEFGDLTKLIATIPCTDIDTSFKDSRIKSFVALAPGLGLGFERTRQTNQVTDPVLIMAAANDQVAPVPTNAAHYYNLIPSAHYVLLPGKPGHYVFLNEGDDALKKEAKQLFKDDKTVDRTAIHRLVEQHVLAFLKQTLIKQ